MVEEYELIKKYLLSLEKYGLKLKGQMIERTQAHHEK